MKRSLATAALTAALLAAASAQAALLRYGADLSGLNEVPPVVTPGYGQVMVEYNDMAQTLRIYGSFADLGGDTTRAHIHCCALPGINASVATTLPSLAGIPLGVTSGAFDVLLDLTDAGSFNPAFVTGNGGTPAGAEAVLAAGLAAGETYFNVHTISSPGGEIRGNLAAVPEPATLALLGIGLAGLAAARIRKR